MSRSYPGKTNIFFLPIINHPSSNKNCILSILTFIAQQDERYGITPVVIFDQPLWLNSMKTIAAEGPGSSIAKVVARLRGVHALMSFVGAIRISNGWILTERLFQLIYDSGTVLHLPYLLSSKAIS